MAGPETGREPAGGLAFLGGEAGGDRGQGDCAVAEDADRFREQIAGVDAAREADDDLAEVGEPAPEPGDLVVQGGHRVIMGACAP